MKYYPLIILATLPAIVEAQDKTFVQVPFLNNLTNTANVAEGLFSIAIIIAAILVVIRLIWAGTQYMLSGLVTSKETAKNNIRDALIGLLIILGSVTILQTINPTLLNLNALGGIKSEGGFANNDLSTSIDGDYFVGDFKVGDSFIWTEMRDWCKREAPQDEQCDRRIVAALADKCEGNLEREEDFWQGTIYSCR